MHAATAGALPQQIALDPLSVSPQVDRTVMCRMFLLKLSKTLFTIWCLMLQEAGALADIRDGQAFADLLSTAQSLRDTHHSVVTFSPKACANLNRALTVALWPTIAGANSSHLLCSDLLQVFIPLTRVCRDACGYCTFALPPTSGRRCYMTLAEVLSVARLGAAQGCTEALFTLGGTFLQPLTPCDSL